MTRVPCNFSEFSSSRYGCSSEEKLQEEQDNEAVLRKEVERLWLLIKRMTGKDDGVNFTELLPLESHLKDVQCVVLDQMEKIKLEEDERLHKQKEAEGGADGRRRGVLVPCKFSASSSEETRKKRKRKALRKMKRVFERRSVESLQSEFDRLWLFNERMNGRELKGMTSFDLNSLHTQIILASVALNWQRSFPIIEQRAKQRKETNKGSISRSAERQKCSLENDKDDETSLQFRLLLVSRKLRRLHNCYHRKSMPETRSVFQSRVTSD